MKSVVRLIGCGLLIACCSFQVHAKSPARPADDSAANGGWETLFDGTSTDQWRNYKKETLSSGWKVKDGALVRSEKGAGDIVTKQKYDAFELSLEYRISSGGNSGLMFHVVEGDGPPWRTGPEIQIQDNVDGHDPQKSGWLYQLYKPASKDGSDVSIVDATKPAGQWNQMTVRISPQGSKVSVNGVDYYEFTKGTDEWNKRVAASKFAAFEGFGKAATGHICLQDHGNEVAFRNIKVRRLTPAQD